MPSIPSSEGLKLSGESWWLMAASRSCAAPTQHRPWRQQGMAITFCSKMVFGFLITHFPCFRFSHSSLRCGRAALLHLQNLQRGHTPVWGHTPDGSSTSHSKSSTVTAPFWGSPAPKGSKFPPDDWGRLRLTPQHPGVAVLPRAPPSRTPSSLCGPQQRLCRAGRLPARRGRARKGHFEC